MKKRKQAVSLTIDEESMEVVRRFCERTGQSFSSMVDVYVNAMAETIKIARLDKKEVVTRADLIRLGLKGLKKAL